MSNDIFKNITEYYQNLPYYTKYFTDIWFTIIFTLIVILIVIYLYIKIRINIIRNDWSTQRCNPIYIPFAGLIQQYDGKSVLESSQINFTHCQNTILNSISNKFVSPLDYLLSVLTSIINMITISINLIRNLLARLKKKVLEIMKPIIIKIIAILHPIIVILIYFKDLIFKIIGVLKSVILLFISYVITLISIILNLHSIFIMLTLIAATAARTVWILAYYSLGIIIPPGLGSALFALFTATAIPLTIFTIVLTVWTIIIGFISRRAFKTSNTKGTLKPTPPLDEETIKNMKRTPEEAALYEKYK